MRGDPWTHSELSASSRTISMRKIWFLRLAATSNQQSAIRHQCMLIWSKYFMVDEILIEAISTCNLP
jgi:hypothetical protein